MSSTQVFITRTSHYFPNGPVPNEEMEQYLGYINQKPSKSKKMVLRNNGIRNRYYALDQQGRPTHSNAQMTAEAVRALFPDGAGHTLQDMDLLVCGTSTPDQLIPSHGVMTHGALAGAPPVEVISPAGVCCAGMHALKHAYLAVKAGESHLAVSAGSERFSGILGAQMYEDEIAHLVALEANPYIAFQKDFLRWMLSDGAAAFLLSDTPNAQGQSLRIDWIEGASYANEMDVCMYMGGDKLADGSLRGYMEYTPDEIRQQSIFSIKQDISLLGDNIVRLGGRKIKEILDRKGMKTSEIDHFLPHISSEFFRERIKEMVEICGGGVPDERWFINLPTVGNVGAASIYLMVDELLQSGRLKQGEKILLLVPESARFSYMFALLTVC